jgi:hypothetical protein
VAYLELGGDLVLGERLIAAQLTGSDSLPQDRRYQLMGRAASCVGQAAEDTIELQGHSRERSCSIG